VSYSSGYIISVELQTVILRDISLDAVKLGYEKTVELGYEKKQISLLMHA